MLGQPRGQGLWQGPARGNFFDVKADRFARRPGLPSCLDVRCGPSRQGLRGRADVLDEPAA
ncbi:hypothetical protein FHR81_002445 [Actinoalloteichus hoggarensis]|uniref:hypothetical protein n=1 Tax=Actinoalloteichus hoggarensis TaxID=1470176 RepID=UPI000B8AD239|nr:hypothetical protein [Actinoalloteichus hoggarensis]MBB5921405.1 hypothetical protein [Actinoalloteichus hoggarensis]